MPVTCTHLEEIAAVDQGLDVCPLCVETGSRWVHLRQCMTCGQTGCCTSSPNTHASKHAAASGHPIMRSLEEDEDWLWCFLDEQQFRAVPGGYFPVDPFLEAGLWYAHEAVATVGALPTDHAATAPDGFPIGEWVATYRTAQGSLEPEQVTALEALPGWTWAAPEA